jgi:hypothetical protein
MTKELYELQEARRSARAEEMFKKEWSWGNFCDYPCYGP